MADNFIYRKIRKCLASIANDLDADAAVILDSRGLYIAKYSKSDELDKIIQIYAWVAIIADKILDKAIGRGKTTFVSEDGDRVIIIRGFKDDTFKAYLELIIPKDVPMGMALLEAEYLEREIRDMFREVKISDKDKETINRDINEVVKKIENHPLFHMLIDRKGD